MLRDLMRSATSEILIGETDDRLGLSAIGDYGVSRLLTRYSIPDATRAAV
jgi:hypothetical protein